jgi:nucleotide-binding universal stress UspA family protein
VYKKLLVPLDGSEVSESIMPLVIAVAKPSKASVGLFQAHARSERPVREVMGEDIAKKLETVTREDTRTYLEKIGGDLAKQGIKTTIIVAEGRPAEAIVEYAERNAIDLILMATHGRSGITRWAFGSVADKVLRQSPVPVLLAPVAGART